MLSLAAIFVSAINIVYRRRELEEDIDSLFLCVIIIIIMPVWLAEY